MISLSKYINKHHDVIKEALKDFSNFTKANTKLLESIKLTDDVIGDTVAIDWVDDWYEMEPKQCEEYVKGCLDDGGDNTVVQCKSKGNDQYIITWKINTQNGVLLSLAFLTYNKCESCGVESFDEVLSNKSIMNKVQYFD